MGKKHKRSRTLPWSVAPAARHALRHRRDLLDNHQDNPFVHAMAAENNERVIARWRDNLPDLADNRRDRTWMALAELSTPEIDPDTPELAKSVATAQIADEHKTLQDAETYVISPGMHVTVVAAAQTVEPADLVTLPTVDDIPSLAGLLVLPDVQMVSRVTGAQADVRAFTWRITEAPNIDGERFPIVRVRSWVASDGPMQYPDFIALRRLAKQDGHPLPGLISEYHNHLRLDDHKLTDEEVQTYLEGRDKIQDAFAGSHEVSQGTRIGEYTGATIEDDGQFALRYLYAFWRLCTQRMVAVTRRAEVDGPGAAPTSPEEENVRIVQLRSFTPYTEEEAAERPRTYRHRWVVRTHKVRQWYPSEQTHKMIWRGPYVKGPTGAPLLTEDSVNALVR